MPLLLPKGAFGFCPETEQAPAFERSASSAIALVSEQSVDLCISPKKLSSDISNAAAEQILQRHGYDTATCERCIVRLARRLRCQDGFPHELGLFLGYPPEDVCGFIENKACNCKCVGCWKVYGDEEAARKKFAQYKKCTKIYCDQWAKGKDIERLTVAG